jgi:hypothetical protein
LSPRHEQRGGAALPWQGLQVAIFACLGATAFVFVILGVVAHDLAMFAIAAALTLLFGWVSWTISPARNTRATPTRGARALDGVFRRIGGEWLTGRSREKDSD